MKLIYFTNIFDDSTKKDRHVNKMSMAASKKILSFYNAMLNNSNIFNKDTLHIVSLGITNIQKNIKIFRPHIITKYGYKIHMGIFVRIKIIRDIFSLFWGGLISLKLVKKNDIVIFYGWIPQLIFSLIVCRIIGAKCVLDIEDGPPEKISNFSSFFQIILFHVFSFLCKHGTVVASKKLLSHSRRDKKLIFYPPSTVSSYKKNYDSEICNVYFGGSLMTDTGLKLLVETIEKLSQQPDIFNKIEFSITGYLNNKNIFYKRLSKFKNVYLLGNISFKKLDFELEKCIIGLSLKLPNTRFGETTFPSKVVDITARGMLLITTDISDIREIYASSVLYLNKVSSEVLCNKLINVYSDRIKLKKMAIEAKIISDNLFSPLKIARIWDNFVATL